MTTTATLHLRRLAIAALTLSAVLPALAQESASSSASAEASAAASAAPTATPAPTPTPTPTPEKPGPRVLMKTNLGEIVLELNAEKAPISTNNFLSYVKNGHYNGTVFHRVIAGFMIQGGGFDKELKQKPTQAPIQNEAKNGLKNETYTIAMARTNFPHSASSQFFINVNNNSPLDYPSPDGWGYAVFGRVIKGTEVVDKIAATETGGQGPFQKDVPTKAIVVESASVMPDPAAAPATTKPGKKPKKDKKQ